MAPPSKIARLVLTSAVLGALVGCAAPIRTIQYRVDDSGAAGTVSPELEAYLEYTRGKSSLGQRWLSPFELLYAGEIAGRDGEISRTELDLIVAHDQFKRPIKDGDARTVAVTGAAEDLMSYRKALGKEERIAFTIEVGPYTVDPTRADPSALFGRRQERGSKPTTVHISSFFKKARFYPKSHKVKFMPFRRVAPYASALRFDHRDVGVGYAIIGRFANDAEAKRYYQSLSGRFSKVRDWSTICGTCSEEQVVKTRTEGKKRYQSWGFLSNVALEPAGGSSHVLVVLTREPMKAGSKAEEAVLGVFNAFIAEFAKREAARKAHAAAEASDQGWPPPNGQQYSPEAYLEQARKAERQGDEAAQTMHLILGAQAGNDEAARALIPRLRKGTGLQSPAPLLADAWELRLSNQD